MLELSAFREVLDRRGFSSENIAHATGRLEFVPGEAINTRFFRHRIAGHGTLGTLLRFFILNEALPAAELAPALEPVPLEEWEAAGFLTLHGETARALFRLQAVRGLILACDLAEVGERPDQVMGLTQSTLLLADFTIRRPVQSLLDIGTGSGVQAFLAARGHALRVTGTDASARAVEFAHFNAGLNRIDNAEFLPGSGFEPVAGCRFDQIVCNPPFFISPSKSLLFRDSGMPLDGFAEMLVSRSPEFLNDGGYCQIECNWVQRKGEDWKLRLASWAEGTGCDLWVLELESMATDQYARNWISDTEPSAIGKFDEWMAFYEQEHLEAIHTGLIALRKSGHSSPWTRIDEHRTPTIGAFGDAVELGFRLRDYLRDTSNAALAEAVLRIAPTVELRQQARFENGRWLTESAELQQTSGLRFLGNIDRNSLSYISECDGIRPLREILAKFPAAAHPACLGIARHLIERGFLLPAGIDPMPAA